MNINEQMADAGIVTIHHFADGIYSKEMQIPAGIQLGKHKHSFDHFSALMQGSAEVSIDGEMTVHHAPAMLVIAAGKQHVITAITDIVWHCIHATDEKNPDVIDQQLIEDQS